MPPVRPPARVYRLTGAGAYDAVFRNGQRSEGQYVQVIAVTATAGVGRAGYVIGRKTLARAVDRNFVRRRFRESVRALRPAIDGFDVILRLKRAANRSEQKAATLEAAQLLATLVRSRA
ncbi:MAG: ribonuclease P protein component [Betaproteobacteria bacterium]|nr:ribonuclease P protein component [Betaproteobacteria bacterium]